MGRSFEGQVAWITGGGSGLGEALARELASQGARVAVSGRRQERLEQVVAAIEAGGGEALAVPCDVTDEASLREAVAAIVARWGRLDVAVANAGFGVSGRVEKVPLDDWRRQFDINVLGVVATAQAALPELRKTRGRLALVASVMGMLCTPGTGPYSASKFAVRAIGLTLSQELHGTGVSCTTIHPGFVESEIAKVDNKGRLHEDRRDTRPEKLMWRADAAARVMARAIEQRKREYVFTWHGRFGAFMGQHMPSLVHLALTRSKAGQRPSKSDD